MTMEYTCPKCGAIALVWVDDITLNDEVVGRRTEVRCFSCGYRKVNYQAEEENR